MATPTTKPGLEAADPRSGIGVPAWPGADSLPDLEGAEPKPTRMDALQALLAFSTLHDQIRRRKALASRQAVFDGKAPAPEFDPQEQFVLDDVLKVVAERALAITGADGLAIALAENNEIVLRAATGIVRPDVGARIDRDSAFSGACFRTAQVVNCDDTETDPRVNLESCRKLGARSMVAVPLCGRRRVIGVLEAFSAWPFGFNESDVQNLALLAELVLAALKPEDEERFAESAKAAEERLESKTADAVSAQTDAHSTDVQPYPVAAASPAEAKSAAGPAVFAPSITPKAAEVIAHAEAIVAFNAAKAGVEPATKGIGDKAAPAISVAATPVIAERTAGVAKAAPIGKASAPDKIEAQVPIAVRSNESLATETASDPEFSLGQAAPARSSLRPGMFLIAIVIVMAFAGGVWWKLKMAEVNDAIVPAEQASAQHANPQPQASQHVSQQVPRAPTVAKPPANENDATDTDDTADSPATPQALSKFPRVTGVRHWSSPDSSTVVLDLEDQVQYEAHRLSNPDRVYFDLHDTQLSADLIGKSIDVGDAFIGKIRLAQPVAGMTRIVLETRASTNFSVSLEANPYRLSVEVRKNGTNPKGAVNLFPNLDTEKSKLAIVVPPPTKEDLQLRARVPKMRIVVDAGHGGWDLGTVGKRGLLEKDLVLEIAQRLGKLLQTRLGTEVVYTRQDDNYIPLDQRAEIANTSQADLFVSVHANYSDLPSARGVETYYTNFFSAPGSKDAPKDSGSATNNTASPLLSPADLHDRIEQSRRLAASVQRSLYGTLSVQNPGLRDRGIKEASFVVLTESAMPGILAEVSFVSSPTDEQKLRSDGYRERIAEALYKGIARYAVASRGVKVASASK
jgi:N-acetylmuramoyl-L-alanine amidase/putative methionine-R-sulfoxide reductase with GAF domain